MPIYEYRCTKGHTFETFQSMSEDPISKCVECGAESERVLSAPAVHFKGSGFYTTDYARKGKKGSGNGTGESSTSDGGESKSSDSKSSGDSKKSADSSGSSSGDSKSSSASKSD